MPDTGSDNALRRKARAHAGSSRAAPAVADVWRRVLPRVAHQDLGLELRVAEVEEGTTTLAKALDGCSEGTLLIGLGRGGGPIVGLALVDEALLAGLIEIQTTGRVSSIRVDPRRPTSVDYALVAHVLDAWQEAVQSARPDDGLPMVAARRLADPRAAILAVDEGQFRQTRVALDLGDGKRTGYLRLLRPVARKTPVRPATPDNLRAALMPIPTELEAVLCRFRLPFGRIAGLKEGELLPLPGANVRRMTLEAPRGRIIAPGHLGQSAGFRAVRVLDAREAEAEPDRSQGFSGNPSGIALGGRGQAGTLTPPSGAAEPAPLDAPDLPPLGAGDDLPDLPPLGD